MTDASESVRTGRWVAAVLRWVLMAQLITLLALAQVIFAGYRLGVGNQSIQIPFLKHLIDPTLYANDVMVTKTLADYPSFFFRLLARVVGTTGHVESMYFWLHVATAAAVLAAAYGLGRAMFRDRLAAIVLVVLMLAGHHRALAGDDLYSLGFTHTWAVFPAALLAMILLYRQWYVAAFAIVGLLFNLHALTAGYLLVMFLAWAIFEYRAPGWRWRLPLMVALFAVLAWPTIAEMAGHRQQWGAEWLKATKIRSSDHSFPSSWWTTGTGDVPRFALLAGLAAVALSFAPTGPTRRKSMYMAGGVGVLFLIGILFADVWPVPTVIRAQLFRSSRFLVVLMLAHVAFAIAESWRLAGRALFRRSGRPPIPWKGSDPQPPPAPGIPVLDYHGVPGSAGIGVPLSLTLAYILEAVLATVTLICLAVPGFMALAPWLLGLSLMVALINGRLAWAQALVGSVALLVTVAAWQTIDYDIPFVDGELALEPLRKSLVLAGGAPWAALGAAVGAWLLARLRVGPRLRLCGAVAASFTIAMVALYGYRNFADPAVAGRTPWVALQEWAAKNTTKDAVFLTPPSQGGFRVHSGRSVVCEWRDGTQLYFTAGFVEDWWNRLTAIRPELLQTKAVADLLQPKSLETMGDQEVIKLANAYGASHVILKAGRPRDLKLKYTYGDWAIYEPRVINTQDNFIEDVALPNIEKYRKSDARVELADADGQTITDGEFQITQTKQAFGFGCSIPFFQTPVGEAASDFEPPPVTPKELELFKAVFNYSVIPFSAKWQRIEPVEGERHYEELDKYVDWCTKNGVTMEFHYLSAFVPRWVAFKTDEEKKAAWMRHCRETVDRYHDRIKYWQITNDGRGAWEKSAPWTGEVIKEIRAKYPDLKLGISDCSAFFALPEAPGAVAQLLRGYGDIEQLKFEGAVPDFFATHGHKPFGAWIDMRQMYECIDAFAELGVKVQISEATLDLGFPFVSWEDRNELRKKTWSPELAAEFFEKYYTTAFSHPAMEAINYWDLGPSVARSGFRGPAGPAGPGGSGRAGLLDPNNDDEPRPLYNKLKELIRTRWMTRLDGAVPGDGAVTFRGFHGDYEIAVKTAGGKTLRGTFTVQPNSSNAVQLKLTEAAKAPGGIANGN